MIIGKHPLEQGFKSITFPLLSITPPFR